MCGEHALDITAHPFQIPARPPRSSRLASLLLHSAGEMLLRLPVFVPATISYSRVWVAATPGSGHSHAAVAAAIAAAVAAAAATAAAAAAPAGAAAASVAPPPILPERAATPAAAAAALGPVPSVVAPVAAHWRVITVESRLYVLQGDICIAYAPFCRFCRVVAHPASDCVAAAATEHRRLAAGTVAPAAAAMNDAAPGCGRFGPLPPAGVFGAVPPHPPRPPQGPLAPLSFMGGAGTGRQVSYAEACSVPAPSAITEEGWTTIAGSKRPHTGPDPGPSSQPRGP